VFPLSLTLEELYHGASHRYRIGPPPTSTRGSDPAAAKATKTIIIKTPPGTRPGMIVRAAPGVAFEVHEVVHPHFRRMDADLWMCIELPWPGADRFEMQEGMVKFGGIGGEEVLVDMPASLVAASEGTRVKGKGMPIARGGVVVGYGDLFIRCVVPCRVCGA